MRSCSDTIIDVLALASIAILGLLLTLFLLPPLEQSRDHVRRTQAWHDTRKIAAELDEVRRKSLLAEPDPWRQPYRVLDQQDGSVRVVSSGPNMTSPATGMRALSTLLESELVMYKVLLSGPP